MTSHSGRVTARPSSGDYRHVSELRLACSQESDLVTMRGSLTALGVDSVLADGVLRCADPMADHDVVVQVTEAPPLTPPPVREVNRPGTIARVNRRSSAAIRPMAPPRRVGHVVFGSTDVAASVAFYRDGLGFKLSDAIEGGVGAFLRCSTDHHNLLVMPAPVPCMNHYAVEMDDVDTSEPGPSTTACATAVPLAVPLPSERALRSPSDAASCTTCAACIHKANWTARSRRSISTGTTMTASTTEEPSSVGSHLGLRARRVN